MSPIIGGASGGAGGLSSLFDSTLGANAASIDTGANGIAAGHSDLLILLYLRSTAGANDTLKLTFNGDTAANYAAGGAFGGAGTGSWANNGVAAISDGGLIVAADRTANRFSAYSIHVPLYGGANFKAVTGSIVRPESATSTTTGTLGGVWLSTAAINQVTVTPTTGPNFLAGSRMVIYGLH